MVGGNGFSLRYASQPYWCGLLMTYAVLATAFPPVWLGLHLRGLISNQVIPVQSVGRGSKASARLIITNDGLSMSLICTNHRRAFGGTGWVVSGEWRLGGRVLWKGMKDSIPQELSVLPHTSSRSVC